jgi:hypothetical protein
VEKEFRLRAGVVKDQRGAVAADLIEDRLHGVAAAAPCPWRGGVGFQHGDVGVGAGVGLQDVAGGGGQVAGQRGRVFDRGGEADAAQAGGEGFEARQEQHELIAAFGFGERMQFVDHNPLEGLEDSWRVFVGEEKGEGFRRGEQDMRRVGALAAALGVGGVAGAILDPDWQARAFDGGAEVAADVGGEGLERRDVEGVQALGRGLAKLGQGGQETRQRFAAAGWGDEEGGGGGSAVKHGLLVRVEGPATGGEPVGEGFGKDHTGKVGRGAGRGKGVADQGFGENGLCSARCSAWCRRMCI